VCGIVVYFLSFLTSLKYASRIEINSCTPRVKGKGKVVVIPRLNEAPRYEDVLRSGGIVPLIL